MILANITVAQQTAVNLPEQALLRRHDVPMERRLVSSYSRSAELSYDNCPQNVFAERASRLGYTIDISSSSALMRSLQAIEDPMAKRLMELLCSKATHPAKYFCAGMLDIAKYHHYALNAPLYTHFTSPIRRYADILVHRQLESILQGGGVLELFLPSRATNAINHS